jgi:hypothetical protein
MLGYKTYLVAFLMAFLPAITEKVSGVDWVSVLGSWGVPQNMVVPAAGLVAALIMAFMRFLTQITTVHNAIMTEPPKADE